MSLSTPSIRITAKPNDQHMDHAWSMKAANRMFGALSCIRDGIALAEWMHTSGNRAPEWNRLSFADQKSIKWRVDTMWAEIAKRQIVACPTSLSMGATA